MSDWTGVLDLAAEERQGKTVTKKLYFRGAFKIQRPIYHHPMYPSYYILNPGGGYLDGDTYRMRVSLEKDARMLLTTQSATKVYKTPNKHAYQESEIHLKEGSFLEYLPDPLIAYKDARYFQKNIFRMEKGAALLYSDILTPGWSPEGKHFSYDSLRLINEIYYDEELLVFDHIKLDPKEKHMNGLGFMEGFTHLGSFIVVGDQVNTELIDQLYETISQQSGDFKFGISSLMVPGFSIRVMANATQVIERIFAASHYLISQEWFATKPSFLRKY
ncbi:urease accessory protein UreD [Oceanobacillus sp. FSL H7-0719]|uniref:urease accessory protein UreD n=1 Tax=Oceanobacillus sp. FSL H7-0719 TaxID=2954507 RepID=UPI003245B0F9